MATLRELGERELPLNRKERFFTGTVFPMIVCRDNFKYFHLFASLIGLGEVEIRANPNSTNIQFFTEYGLAESIYDEDTKRRFAKPPRRKDTPDIMILITGDPKVLIAIEAKMYDAPEIDELGEQMDNQSKYILNYLKQMLHIEQVFHYALLPEKLGNKMSDLEYQKITWEKIRDTYKDIYPGDYFLDLLDISLDCYERLVSHSWAQSNNCEMKMRGLDIYNKYKADQLNMRIMGRDMGLTGKNLLDDIRLGRWRRQSYETSSKNELPSNNWFLIQEFVELIDKVGS